MSGTSPLTSVTPSVSHQCFTIPTTLRATTNFPHQLAVDKRYHAACPKVLYRANNDRLVLPKIYLDQVDHKHLYMAFQNQVGGSMLVVTLDLWCNLVHCLKVWLVFSGGTCPRVHLWLLHDLAGLLVCAGSLLRVVQR